MPTEASSIWKKLSKVWEREKNARWLLVASPINVKWASHFSSTSTYILISKNGQVHVFTDPRYGERAEAHFKGCTLHISSEGAGEALKSFASRRKLEVLLDPEEITASQYFFLKEIFREIKTLKGIFKEMRAVKTEEEIKILKQGYRLNLRVFEAFLNELSSFSFSLTEKEATSLLKQIILSEGFDGWSFEPMVLAGKSASNPHGENSSRKIESASYFLVDFGGTYRGMATDETVMVYIRKPPRYIEQAHGAVKEAMEYAIECARPGSMASHLHRCAREVLSKYGLERHFIHGLGHGVGMEVHEFPVVSQKSRWRIEKGMVFTVEPGVYFSGRGGVRLESTVLITEKGAKVISKIPKGMEVI